MTDIRSGIVETIKKHIGIDDEVYLLNDIIVTKTKSDKSAILIHINSQELADSLLKFLKEKAVDKEKISKLLHTTKIGTGYHFSNSTTYDLFLKDYEVDKQQTLILATTLSQQFLILKVEK